LQSPLLMSPATLPSNNSPVSATLLGKRQGSAFSNTPSSIEDQISRRDLLYESFVAPFCLGFTSSTKASLTNAPTKRLVRGSHSRGTPFFMRSGGRNLSWACVYVAPMRAGVQAPLSRGLGLRAAFRSFHSCTRPACFLVTVTSHAAGRDPLAFSSLRGSRSLIPLSLTDRFTLPKLLAISLGWQRVFDSAG